MLLQLLACALRQERPELEQRRSELLRQEEELKLKLDQLQEILLQELASAQGDILQNKVSKRNLEQVIICPCRVHRENNTHFKL